MGSNMNEGTKITPKLNTDGVGNHEDRGVAHVNGTGTYHPRNDFEEEEEIVFVPETDGVGNDEHGNDLGAGDIDTTVDESELPRNKKRLHKFKLTKTLINRLSKAENDDSATYPADCYSFISAHAPNERYFWFGVMVFLVQMSFLMLMILHVTLPDWRNGTVDDNPAQEGWFADFIATEASPMLRGSQFMSLFTFLVFVDASLLDLITAVHTFPKYKYITKRDNFGSMVFSCALRFSQGLAATIAAIFLIFTTNDVIDVILNFTALNFISTLDDMAFELAKSGKYGPFMEEEAKRIEELPLPVCMFRKYKHIRIWFTIVPLASAVLACFVVIACVQDYSGGWDTQSFRLEFDMNSELEAYNGCYHWTERGKKFKRRSYGGDDRNHERAQFGFCVNKRQWYLYEKGDDVCNQTNIIIQSTQTDTFDISTVFLDDWFDVSDTPVELYFEDNYEAENGNLYCDQFIHDGICNSNLNTDSRNWDGGDCCALTCDHQNCSIEGLQNAFETNTVGDGYSNCKDPKMRPLTIQLNAFTNSRDLMELSRANQTFIENFVPDFFSKVPSDAHLWLSCDGVKVLKVYINESMAKKNETVMVPDRSTCNMIITNTTSFNPTFNDDPIWYVNFTVYNGDNERTPILVEGNTHENGDVEFDMIPDCFFEELPNINGELNVDFQNDFHSQAIKWLMDNEPKKFDKSICKHSILERYALAVLNFAAPITPSNTSGSGGLWIQQGRKCSWKNIVCGRGGSTFLDLIDLDLSGVGLAGYIPTEIGLLKNLALYDASNNKLTGSIPTEIGVLTQLSLLKLNDNHLNGTIPCEIGSLTLLQELFLEKNSWQGAIPSEIGLLKDLHDLALQDNFLTGSIPSEIFLLTQLTLLQIGGTNRLTGNIPSEIGLLKGLRTLNLNNNDLKGTIPTEIGELTSLSRLSIDKTSLTGSIPSEIGLLTSLTMLNLDETLLTGSFPTEIKKLKRLKRLYMNDVAIPKDSLPASFANRVAEKCILCGGNNYEIADSENYRDENATIIVGDHGYEYTCVAILYDLKLVSDGGKISIEECNILKDQCIVCTDF